MHVQGTGTTERRARLARMLRSLAGVLVIVIGVTFLAFLLSYLSPTDPATQYFSRRGVAPTAAELAAKRSELGLDRPFFQQYLDWLLAMLQGDMGESYRTGRSISASLASYLPNTLLLSFLAMGLTLLISVPVGLACAYRKDGIFDRLVRALSCVLCSLPTFLGALLLLYFLSVRLQLFPVSAEGPLGIVLPTLSLALPLSAWYVRQVRAIALKQLTSGYVDGLRSRGVSESAILFKHVLKNSLVPLLSIVGISLGGLLGGSAVVECIFSWPGVGNYAVSAINSRDYSVIQAYALVMALTYLVLNAALNLVYRALDPRIRKGAS